MTAQTDTSRRDELIAANLAAVETHFHNETPETIDAAIGVYTDDIVWEVPARGLVLRHLPAALRRELPALPRPGRRARRGHPGRAARRQHPRAASRSRRRGRRGGAGT